MFAMKTTIRPRVATTNPRARTFRNKNNPEKYRARRAAAASPVVVVVVVVTTVAPSVVPRLHGRVRIVVVRSGGGGRSFAAAPTLPATRPPTPERRHPIGRLRRHAQRAHVSSPTVSRRPYARHPRRPIDASSSDRNGLFGRSAHAARRFILSSRRNTKRIFYFIN